MATHKIPNTQGQVRQTNRGDNFGELWGSYNLDLTSTVGKLKAAKRLKRVLSNSDLSAFDVVALTLHDGKYYMVTGDEVWSCSVSSDPTALASWSMIATLSIEDVGFESDAVSFNNLLLVSLGTDIMSWNSDSSTKDDDWWTVTTTGTTLTANYPHVMHVHRGGQETLFVTDKDKVRYYNTTAGHTAITLHTLQTACAVTSGVDTVWVGTYTESNDYAYVYEIQVGNTAPTRAYRIDGRAVLSMDVYDNVPYIVTDRGHIQAFNGSGFQTVQAFPFAFKGLALSGVRPGLVQDTSISRPIHPKGMRVCDDSFFIFVNTENELSDFSNTVVDERSPSGMWEYNLATNVLNHRASLTDQASDKGVHTLQRTSPVLMVDNQYTKYLVGGEVGGSASMVGLSGEDLTTAPLAYFTTPFLVSDTVQETYEKVVLKAKTLGANESITVKYRTTEYEPVYADVTWLNTTQFTTTDSLESFGEGDEIEIMYGECAGEIAHITTVEGGTTKTITIDTALTTALNDTSHVRIQNWKKISDTYTSTDGEVKTIGINVTAPWIQYKVVMRGFIELRQFISKGNAKNEL
jgi:hypothetical protein